MTPWYPIETDRLLLRDFRLEDEGHIYDYASDPEVVRFADWGPSDLSTVRSNLHRRLEDQERWPRDSLEVAVELRSNSYLIGIMRITVLDHTTPTEPQILDTLSIGATGPKAMQLKVRGPFCIWLSRTLVCIESRSE